MPCYHPLSAWRDASGALLFSDRGRGDRIDLPCGRCVGCRLERSRQWATRIMFEAQAHEQNCFITLTYDDANLPDPPSLNYKHYQDFMKRLRNRCGPVRFYACGEYGDRTRRPHYHACLFGIDFSDDKKIWKANRQGDGLYISPLLTSIWGLGHTIIGDLTFDSAAYVARYVMKKVTGDLAEHHYQYTDANGVIHQLEPEMAHMSRRPGIGATWYEKYASDVYPQDHVIINGRPTKPPRYFDRLLRRELPELYLEMKEKREYDGYQRRADNTDRRLNDKEAVKKASIRHFIRDSQ